MDKPWRKISLEDNPWTEKCHFAVVSVVDRSDENGVCSAKSFDITFVNFHINKYGSKIWVYLTSFAQFLMRTEKPSGTQAEKNLKKRFIEFKEELVSKIRCINPGGKLKYLNVLLVGQVGSGKTSFINTCDTAISNEGRVKSRLTELPSSASVTTKLETIPLRSQQGKDIPLRLFDCRGLHMENGVPTKDIRSIVYGHVRANYTINPMAPISEGNLYYRTNPELKHKMHCIVYVLSAVNPTDNFTDEKTHKQLKHIRDNLLQNNIPIPQVLLVSKIDRLDISNTPDLKHIFRSRNVQTKCNEAAQYIGLQLKDVFPMSNYLSDQVQCLEIDILGLHNLYNIMAKANEFVERVAGDDLPPGFNDDENNGEYIYDVLSINNPDLLNNIVKMYRKEMDFKDTTGLGNSAPNRDLHFSTDTKGKVSINIYDKHDDFPFHDSNNPSLPTYGVFFDSSSDILELVVRNLVLHPN